MSVHAISWVLRYAPAEGNARLVLIVLADKANEDGTGAYPSVETIGREARIRSKTTVRKHLRELERAGAIAYEGESPLKTKSWRVLMDRGDDFRAANWGAEGAGDPGGSQTLTPPQIDPEPSIEPPLEQAPDKRVVSEGSGPAGDRRPPEPAELEAWGKALEQLRGGVPDFAFHIHLASLELAAVNGRVVYVRPPEHVRTAVEERYDGAILAAVREAFDPTRSVEYVGEGWSP